MGSCASTEAPQAAGSSRRYSVDVESGPRRHADARHTFKLGRQATAGPLGLGKHNPGGLMDLKTNASKDQNRWIAYTNRTGKPVEPERWSDISWIAVLLCLLKIPFQWPWCYLSAKSMHAHRGNMTHLRLTLNGMDKWTALLAHALQVSELTDHDSLVNKHLPKHHEDKQHVRVKNEYLSRVLGEEFWHGQGDYDAWLPQSTMAFVKKVFYKLNTSYPLPATDGPRYHKEEYMHIVHDTFTKLGIYNGYELPKGFDHTSVEGAIHWVTTGYGALFLEKNRAGPGYVSDLRFMEDRPMRDGYRAYGGAMYLTEDCKSVTKIVLQGKAYTPADPEWPGALYVFRSGGVYEAVGGPHTMHSHFLDAALVTTCVREMDADHPLRRLLSPFTIASLAVTFGAAISIAGDGAILERFGGFEPEGVAMMCREWTKRWRMESFADQLKRRGVGGMSAEAYPYGHFAEKLSGIYDKLADEYMDEYFLTDKDVAADEGIQTFFKSYHGLFPKKCCPNPPPARCLTRATLRSFISRFLFAVTAQHEQTGNTADSLLAYDAGFVSVPAHGSLSDLASLQPAKSQRLAVQFIQGLTSKHAPSLYQADTADFQRFFLADCDPKILKRYMNRLWRLHLELNDFKVKHNIEIRPMSSPTIDPIDLKISVTV